MNLYEILNLICIGIMGSFFIKVWFDGSIFFKIHEIIALMIYENKNGVIVYENGEPVEKEFNLFRPNTWHRLILRGIVCRLCASVELSFLLAAIFMDIVTSQSFLLGYMFSVSIIFVTTYSIILGPLNEEREI